MYQKIKELYGKKLSATDGHIGHVTDFYFDDKTWTIRYLVVDTGAWLTGRMVLLTSHAFGPSFGKSETEPDLLTVNLTRKQIEDSPSIDTQRPVSRQYELEYYRYYGWPAYWEAGGMLGVAGFGAPELTPIPEKPSHHEHNQKDDIHLRSTQSITGYNIQATDGAIGSVSGFMVDGRNWLIREIVVETGHWLARKEILLLPINIERISYEDSTVTINLTKEDLKQTMTNDVAQAGSAHR
jgi:uncharacterized protein YrrD